MRQLRTCGGQSCCSHSRALWDRLPAPVQGCPSGLAYPWPLASQGAAGMRPAGWILTSWLCLTPFSLLTSAPWPESRPLCPLCRFLWLGPLSRQVGVGCRLPARSGGGAVTTAVSPVLRPLAGRPGLPFRACPTWQECGAGLPAYLRREPPVCPSLFLRVHLCPAPPPTSSLPVSSLSPRCFSGRSGAVVSGHV